MKFVISALGVLVWWQQAVPAHGAVLCQKKSGAVFVRSTCKKKELTLDPAALGLVGPKGDKGDKGDPGGLAVPCATQAGTDVFFTGCNVHIRSGSGSTTAPPNGLGNLIVGYNEAGVCEASGPISPCNTGADCGIGGVCIPDVGARTGSHNLVVGPLHTYSSYGGFVAGFQNMISAPYASVSGGSNNIASGIGASVSGGDQNFAGGGDTSISGGSLNIASCPGPAPCSTAVSGGTLNGATGDNASVSGGTLNVAGGNSASVSGGASNNASGDNASVSGGASNTASGSSASISGGNGLSQPATNGWAAGSVEPTSVVVGDFESP